MLVANDFLLAHLLTQEKNNYVYHLFSLHLVCSILFLIQQELLEFLDELKESGSINMFGAPKVLQEFFDLDRITAVKIWEEWTKRKLDDA